MQKVYFCIHSRLGAGFCFVAGKSLDIQYSLNLTQKDFYLKWLLCSVILGIIIHLTWELCSKGFKSCKWCKTAEDKLQRMEERMGSKWSFVLAMAVMLLCWLPTWLSIFPGVFSYDAWQEWQQIVTGDITAHHPVLHVLLLGGLAEGIHQLGGSYNLGIALYITIQVLVLSATFAYTIQFLRERKVSPLLRVFALIFYSFSPVINLFAICGTKDIFFSAALLLFMISIYRIWKEQEVFKSKPGWIAIFIGSAFFSMTMRNNGLYIVLLMLFITLIRCRKMIGKYLLMCATVFAVYLLYTGPFYSALDVSKGGVEEMLSVPLQQIARVYHYEKGSFSEEEIAYLHSIVPQDNWEAYRSTVSDFVKSGFVEEEFNKDRAKFFKVWASTGVKHPMTYVSSFLLGSVDFWYPLAVVDGYQDVYGKSSFFDYKVSEPGTEVVLLPALHEFYESLSHEKEMQTIPGMFLLTSPGWYLLLFLLLFLYLWREKRYYELVPLFIILLNFGTVLLGPIALVRYVLIQYFAFPTYCVMVSKDCGKEEN